jgi:hypothetical protein
MTERLIPGKTGTASFITEYFNTGNNTFLVNSLTSNVLWLDSADATTFSFSSGSNISQWRDKSGLANHANVGNGAPTLTASGVAFNAAATTQLVLPVVVNTDWTVFEVFNTTQTVGISGSAWYTGTGIFDAEYPGVTTDFGMSLVGGYLATGVQDTASTVASAALVNTGNKFLANFIRVSATGSVSNILNGGTATTMTAATGIRSAVTRIVMGSLQTNLNYFTGNIYEVVAYNRPLSQVEYQKIEGALAWKWGIQSSLPVAHPYYSSSPIGGIFNIIVRSVPFFTSELVTVTFTVSIGNATLGTDYTITSNAGFTYYNFFATGKNMTLTLTGVSVLTNFILLGGGGGGGANFGGGGGAGGLQSNSGYSLATGVYTVNIGVGGAPSSGIGSSGTNGSNSVFGSFTALGGGGGGTSWNGSSGSVAGQNGGCGGGCCVANLTAFGVGSQGGNGGSYVSGANGGGGGGGVGGTGGSPSATVTGASGIGITWNNGSSLLLGGGGVGGGYPASIIAGTSSYGGGTGAVASVATAGGNGSANTGGGGGGGSGNYGPGGTGGSGFFSIAFPR